MYSFRLHKNLVNMIYEASPFVLFIHFSNALIECFRIDFRKYNLKSDILKFSLMRRSVMKPWDSLKKISYYHSLCI